MKNIAIIRVRVDLSKFKLPDYEYSIDQLADEAGTTCEEVAKSLGLDPKKVDDYETVKTEPVKKKTLDKFKRDLIARIEEDIPLLIAQYVEADLEDPNLPMTIDELGADVYLEFEDLSGECSDGVKIEVMK